MNLGFKNNKNKYLWILAENKYKNGVLNFSADVIDQLKIKGYNIDVLYISRIETVGLNKFYKICAHFINFFNICLYPYRIFFKSWQYKKIIVGGEIHALTVKYVMNKSMIVIHHAPEKLEHDNHSKKDFHSKFLLSYWEKAINKSSQAKNIITPSEFTKKCLIDEYKFQPNKIKVIYTPFQLNLYSNFKNNIDYLKTKYNLEIDSNSILLLNVGCEVNRKNFITLLNTLKVMNKTNIHLIKIGKSLDGKMREMHTQYVKEYNLPATFIDYVDDQDLVDFYHACDIFVNPSLYEGFGRTPIEAQASGLPIISTDCAALSEVLNDSAYIIKEPKNPECYKDAVLNIIQEKKIRDDLINKGYENVKRFTLEEQVRKWEKILTENT